jgi:hypothetical protein
MQVLHRDQSVRNQGQEMLSYSSLTLHRRFMRVQEGKTKSILWRFHQQQLVQKEVVILH